MNKLRISLPETVARLDRLGMHLFFERGESSPRRLSADEDRVLEYFWDRQRRKPRGPLPDSIIQFFESDGAIAPNLVRFWVAVVCRHLTRTGFLTQHADGQDTRYYELTDTAIAYLRRRRPVVVSWWETMLAQSPPEATLAAGLLGLTLSVMGLLRLVHY